MEYSIKDSGERQKFETGAVRDVNTEKGDYSLLPPRALALVAKHFQLGAKKYSKANWRKGIPLSRYLDSGLRHAFKHLNGDTDERHDISCVWNFLCLLETQEMINEGKLPSSLDDLREIRTGYSNDQKLPYEKVKDEVKKDREDRLKG